MASSSEQIISLYERHARKWDADRIRTLFEKVWLERFGSLLPDGGSIVDLGCGSSEPLARYFIEKGFKVCGVDSSPTLISLCRQRFPAQDWQMADMRMLSLGKEFQGLMAWDSFFHLTPDDQRGMFPIFKKHAAPGAVLLFTAGPSLCEAIGSYQGEPLYHASLDGSEYQSLLLESGFDIVDYVIEDPDCDEHTICLAQRRR